MTNRQCSVDGCGRAHYGRGWCEMHYQRWKATGDLGPAGLKRQVPDTCTVPGCNKPYSSKGMCEVHRSRMRRTGSLEPTRIVGDDAARLWSRVDRAGPIPGHMPHLGPCWVWTGNQLKSGHGLIRSIEADTYLAHRLSWHLNVGPIPEGMCVLHHCDNPPCVRPDHLFIGTRADNTADMLRKNRQRVDAGVAALRAFHVGQDNPQARMTAQKVIELRERAAAGEHYNDLAIVFGIAASTANAIILGNSWKHAGGPIPNRTIKKKRA